MLFYTVKTKERREIKIKKSRFIATIFPVSSLDEAKKKIDNIKIVFRNATHYPYALRIGCEKIIERNSDDGEPPRSSGLPILQELKRANLTNTLLVVTRYFGGVKLGLGGLNRAYRESAMLVLDAVKKVRSLPYERLVLCMEKNYSGKVRNILAHFNAKIIQENYVNKAEYIVEIEKERKQEFIETLRNATRGQISIREALRRQSYGASATLA